MDVHEIGNRIKQARTLRNCTLDDIANEIGVAKSTIQRYENGLIIKPKLPVLQAIADSLNVNPAWLSGQEVPMIIDESLNSIINNRLKELNISLDYVAEKSGVSLHWLQKIDSFIPGEFGDYEIGYDWITRVADVLHLPGSKLRAALAKQEVPIYEGPMLTAEEAFKQAQEGPIAPYTESGIDKQGKLQCRTEDGTHEITSVNEKAQQLLGSFILLNNAGQDKALEQVTLLTKIPEYQDTNAKDIGSATIIDFQPRRNSDLFVIPYYRGGVSAGTGIFILGNEAEDDIEIPNTPNYQGADYALDVNGHSMEPDYMDGDIALVSQNMEMQVGDIGVFVVNGSAYIKELGKNELISRNKDYPNILIREEDNVVCMGKVIGKMMD